MKKLLLALALLLSPNLCLAQQAIVGPANGILCGSSFVSAFSIASQYTLVPGKQVNGQNQGIFICGYSASTLSTAVFQMTTTSAASTDCRATPTSTAITPPHGVNSTAPVVDHIDFAFQQAPVLIAPTSPSTLCLFVGGSSAPDLRFILYYSQF